jgi:flagellar biosynthesis protein FlhF
MKIKRFVDKDSRGAMAQVRSALGPEAVILSNKRVGDQVEMVAAVDMDAIASLAQEAETGTAAAPASPGLSLVDAQEALVRVPPAPANEPGVELAQDKVSIGDAPAMTQRADALRQRLETLGLSSAFAGSISASLPDTGDVDNAEALALDYLRERLRVTTQDSLVDTGGILACIGPTGSGKTTSLARLAARFVLRHGKEHLALVTTDCYRVGGQEQLQMFAQYLDVPLFVATDQRELRMTLDQLQHKKLVLIDTPGMGQRDAQVAEQASLLTATGYAIKRCLVLSATSSSRVLQQVATAFGAADLAGVIVTRFDEAVELGNVVETAIRCDLPLAYFGTGQKVPQDMVPAGADALIDRAVDLVAEKPTSLYQTLQDSLTASVNRVRTK